MPVPDEFVHDWPSSRVRFGPGTIDVVGSETDLLGDRPFLISDPTAHDAAEAIAHQYGDRLVGRVSDVVMHVPTAAAKRATEQVKQVSADVIVCVGGGSSTGLAKGVARLTELPIVAVPTTYAGSEMTSIWGLTDEGKKVTGRDERVRPRTVVYDPRLTLTLPTPVSATSGMNAIAHCAEALYSPLASPLALLAAEEGVRALARALPLIVQDGQDLPARVDALRGAWLAGWALNVSTMGLHHKLCHVLGGLFDLPHSFLHTVVLPHVVHYNASAAPEAMSRLALALGVSANRADSAAALWDLNVALGAPTGLRHIGMDATGTGTAVDAVLAALRETTLVNPQPVDRAGLEYLIEAAWTGERPGGRSEMTTAQPFRGRNPKTGAQDRLRR